MNFVLLARFPMITELSGFPVRRPERSWLPSGGENSNNFLIVVLACF